MKRSQINAAIDLALATLAKHHIRLPEYATWSPAQWRKAGPEMSRVTRNGLGWAVTDFGSGDFDRTGITMFDVRNGNKTKPEEGTLYGEKVFVLKPGQRLPYHFHWSKTEDIISRAGGTLMVQLFNARDDETMDETSPGFAYFDGVRRPFTAGQVFEIPHGCSVTMAQKLYHRFWAKEDGDVLVGGEISTVSVPATDNRFQPGAKRFMQVDEDEPAKYLMNVDYPKIHEAADAAA